MNGAEATIFTQIYSVIGFPASLMLLYWLVNRWMKDQKAKVDADRVEHVNKWDSMIKANKEAMENMFKLFDRSATAAERNSHNIIEIKEKLNSIHNDIKKQR